MSACLSVGSGSVGETGATSLLCHTVGGATSKMVVLRRKKLQPVPKHGRRGGAVREWNSRRLGNFDGTR